MLKYLRDRIRLYKLKKDDKFRDAEQLALLQIWKLFLEKDDQRFEKLVNVCIYCSMVNRDIYYLAEHFYFEKDRNRKHFFGRLLCMTIIEFLDDINRMLGKDLKEELIRNHLDEFIDSIKSLNKEYSQIKAKYDNIFRLIRNNASAHKNKDAIQLLHAYQQLPSEELSLITYDIGRLESSFRDLTNLIFTKIIETTNNK